MNNCHKKIRKIDDDDDTRPADGQSRADANYPLHRGCPAHRLPKDFNQPPDKLLKVVDDWDTIVVADGLDLELTLVSSRAADSHLVRGLHAAAELGEELWRVQPRFEVDCDQVGAGQVIELPCHLRPIICVCRSLIVDGVDIVTARDKDVDRKVIQILENLVLPPLSREQLHRASQVKRQAGGGQVSRLLRWSVNFDVGWH